jgi:hypothetical protein
MRTVALQHIITRKNAEFLDYIPLIEMKGTIRLT